MPAVEQRGAYHTYVIRIWRDDDAWRVTLHDPQTGERHGFASPDQLVRYLVAQNEAAGDSHIDHTGGIV